jgi:hypothetical protein
MSFERGLKETSRDIAEMLGLSHESIYVTQRRLAARGIFSLRKGKGPNSGVECTPENLAILMVAFFASHPVTTMASAAARIESMGVPK